MIKKITIICLGFICIIASLQGCINEQPGSITNIDTSRTYQTISKALQEASPGDKIFIKDGEYNEHLTITKSIQIQGESMEGTRLIGDETQDVMVIFADNVTITNLTITGGGNSSDYEEDAGIDIRSEFNLIHHVNFSNNRNYGVLLYNAHNNTIRDCVFTLNARSGVYATACNDLNFSDNIFERNRYGLHLRTITNCIISGNTISAKDIVSLTKGIYLLSSEDNSINNNLFTENNNGMHIKGSKHNVVEKNLFLGNAEGIYFCCGGRDNLVIENDFLSNELHVKGNPINQFNDDMIGNYWDDYTGLDKNDDGIGDTPYNVTEGYYGEQNIDYYPIVSKEKLSR